MAKRRTKRRANSNVVAAFGHEDIVSAASVAVQETDAVRKDLEKAFQRTYQPTIRRWVEDSVRNAIDNNKYNINTQGQTNTVEIPLYVDERRHPLTLGAKLVSTGGQVVLEIRHIKNDPTILPWVPPEPPDDERLVQPTQDASDMEQATDGMEAKPDEPQPEDMEQPKDTSQPAAEGAMPPAQPEQPKPEQDKKEQDATSEPTGVAGATRQAQREATRSATPPATTQRGQRGERRAGQTRNRPRRQAFTLPNTLGNLINLNDNNTLFRALLELEAMSQAEVWGDVTSTETRERFAGLISYLSSAYRRLLEQGSLLVSERSDLIAFDTGLMTDDDFPANIYAVLVRNQRGQGQPFLVEGFCRSDRLVAGLGRRMVDAVGIPEPPTWTGESASKLVYDATRPVPSPSKHALIERFGRYPTYIVAKAFGVPDESAEQIKADCMDRNRWTRGDDRVAILAKRYESPYSVDEVKGNLCRTLESALERAHRMARRSPKIVRYAYYPTTQEMQFYMPLQTRGRREPIDLVAVLATKPGSYVVTTVLTYEMAAGNLRLMDNGFDPWAIPQEQAQPASEPEPEPTPTPDPPVQADSEAQPESAGDQEELTPYRELWRNAERLEGQGLLAAADDLRSRAAQILADALTAGDEHFLQGDFEAALESYSIAADEDDKEGLHAIACLVEQGKGMEGDTERAAALYRKAAAQGYAPSQNNLAKLIISGAVASVYEGEALDLLRRAVAAGLVDAQISLANCYRTGTLVNPNPAEAARLYHLAAWQGDPRGQLALAICYLRGEGVRPDDVTAYELLTLAQAGGLEQAATVLESVFPTERQRSIVAEQLARRFGERRW